MFIWITLEEFWIEGRGDGIGTEWPEIISSVGNYLSLGHSSSFELPQVNAIWSRPETKTFFLNMDLCMKALFACAGLDAQLYRESRSGRL